MVVKNPVPISTLSVSRRRVNGCSLPFHYVQIIAVLVILFLVLMNYLTLCVNIPANPWQWLTIVLSSLAIVPFLIIFITISLLNPAEDGVIRLSRGPRTDFNRHQHAHVITNLYCHVCDVHVTEKAKHCSTCNKCIYAFDHHCIWLNTCVGGKNYRLFLSMLSFIILGTLIIFISALLQFIGSFQTSTSSLTLKPYYNSNQYAILMIPSSPIAFQVITFIIVVISIVVCGLTAYLLGFHIYLCCHGISTYDYVMNQRIHRTVDQTLSQFNQMNQNHQNNSNVSVRQSISDSQKIRRRRRSNQIAVSKENGSLDRSKEFNPSKVFTIEGNQRESPRRLQVCQSTNQEAYVLRNASHIDDGY